MSNVPKKILFAEDDRTIRLNVKEMLQFSGFEVTAVKDGFEAYNEYNESYDLILSDLMMPNMDGIELYKKLKSDFGVKLAPFIFLTAKNCMKTLNESLHLGVDDYILKPFKAEELFERINIRLEKKFLQESAFSNEKLKREFLTNISHEFRSPLNSILSLLRYIQLNTSVIKGNNFDSLLSLLEIKSQKLIFTVENLVIMSLVESKNWDILNKEINIVEELIKPLIENKIQERINSTKVKLTTTFESRDLTARIDKKSLEIILENILCNSIKFTSEGEITLSVRKIDKGILISVEDSGIGISDYFFEYLYTPFRQETSGYNRKFDGLGLGLSLCKKLAVAAGWELNIFSKKNEGTIVELEIKQ